MKYVFSLGFVLMAVFVMSVNIVLAGGGQNQGEIGYGNTEENHTCSENALNCVWDR